MDSYPAIYESYTKFCRMVDATPLSFEDWMRGRDVIPHPKVLDEANKILEVAATK